MFTFRQSHLRCFVVVLSIFCTLLRTAGAANGRMRVRCPAPDLILNGSYKIMTRSGLMRVSCRQGYQLLGPRIIDCVHGKWYGDKPVCARKGCTKKPVVAIGTVQTKDDLLATIFCPENYELAGNRYTYCNGSSWDRELGTCRVSKATVEHSCDFETEGLCGWVSDHVSFFEWKRIMAANIFRSFQTGPRHDHTTMTASGGHYMLMETLGHTPKPIMLSSPIYKYDLSMKTACCFRFYYFMYGSGVGNLSVFVKPLSIDKDSMLAQRDKYMKFFKSGNQNNIWNEETFNIEETEEDFQIIFVATAGKDHLSDIAIDDVRLMIGSECRSFPEHQTTVEYDNVSEVTDPAFMDTQSCVGRCGESSGAGYLMQDNQPFKLCNCNVECEDDDTCCPDFRSVCLQKFFTETTAIPDDATSDAIGTRQPIELITKGQVVSSSILTTTSTMPKVIPKLASTTVTITRTSTTPKATTPKATTPKATTPKATTPKASTPKATTPKTTTTKATTPKPTIPKSTTLKSTTKKTTKSTTTTTTTTVKPVPITARITSTTPILSRNTSTSAPSVAPATITTTAAPVTTAATAVSNTNGSIAVGNNSTKVNTKSWKIPKGASEHKSMLSHNKIIFVVTLVLIGVGITAAVIVARYKYNIMLKGNVNGNNDRIKGASDGTAGTAEPVDGVKPPMGTRLFRAIRKRANPTLKALRYGVSDTSLLCEEDDTEDAGFGIALQDNNLTVL